MKDPKLTLNGKEVSDKEFDQWFYDHLLSKGVNPWMDVDDEDYDEKGMRID